MDISSRSKSWIAAADVPNDAGIDCDQIAYEYVAAIQSHCLFLNLCRWDRRILNISDNCESLVGLPLTGTLGKRCDDSLFEGIDQFLSLLIESSIKRDQLTLDYGTVRVQGKAHVVRATVCRDRIQIEMEPQSENRFYTGNPREFLELGATTLREAGKLDDLVSFLDKLSALLPFSRLGIYRFDEIDHGEILFEKRQDAQIPSYEGLRFPARDIPQSTRRMMMTNPLRFTRDRSLEPSKIFPRKDPLTNEEINLSLSRNRGSVGSCQEYYSNMGIRSSLVIPIICDNRLWGMISGHHSTVINITSEIDPYLISLGDMLSASIKNILLAERMHSEERGRAVVRSLREKSKENLGTLEHLKGHASELRSMFPCDGLILSVAGNLITSGSVPERALLKSYTQKVWDLAAAKTLVSNHIGEVLPELHAISPEFAGILAVPLDTEQTDLAIWLRKEQLREVRWAGAPNQNVRQKSNGKNFLEPRSSFEAWVQTMRGISRDWAKHEVQLAKSSGMQLSILLLSWYSIQSHATKSIFLSSVSQQLRTPLTVILGYAELLEKSLEAMPARLVGNCSDYCNIIMRSGENLFGMVNDILDLTRIEAGAMDIDLVQVEIPRLLQQVIVELQPAAQKRNLQLELEIIGNVPRFIMTDPIRLRQIVLNLIRSSIKSLSDGRVEIKLSLSHQDQSQLLISVLESGTLSVQEQANANMQGLFHAEDMISRRYGAFAIGFMISKKLAQLLGGDLVFQNSASAGCQSDLTITMYQPNTTELIDQSTFNSKYTESQQNRHLPTGLHNYKHFSHHSSVD